MPFWKRKKQARQTSGMPEIREAMDAFRRQMDDIDLTVDAGEKLLKLEDLKTALQSRIDKNKAEIAIRVGQYSSGVFAAGNFVSIAGALALAAGTGIPPLVFLLAPGMMVVTVAAKGQEKKKQAQLDRESSELSGLLQEQKETVSGLSAALLADHLEAVAKSSCRGELFAKYPDVQNRFAEAAAKKLAGADKNRGPSKDAPKGPS